MKTAENDPVSSAYIPCSFHVGQSKEGGKAWTPGKRILNSLHSRLAKLAIVPGDLVVCTWRVVHTTDPAIAGGVQVVMAAMAVASPPKKNLTSPMLREKAGCR